MEGGVYQCYKCGWVGFEPGVLYFEECWEIENGTWKHYPEQLHYVCPEDDCDFLFSIVFVKGEYK